MTPITTTIMKLKNVLLSKSHTSFVSTYRNTDYFIGVHCLEQHRDHTQKKMLIA